MIELAKLMAAIVTVGVLAICLNTMLDVVKIAEERGPTRAAVLFCLNGGIIFGGVAVLFWAVH